MQILINIPKEIEKMIFEDDRFEICYGYELARCVRDGIPLPKGHGRLIDASDLTTTTDIRADGSEFTYVPYSEIKDAPTIIKADSEVKESDKINCKTTKCENCINHNYSDFEPKPKTGKWIKRYDEDGSGELYSYWTCSECGRGVGYILANIEDVLSNYPYCHCGAKMFKQKESEG